VEAGAPTARILSGPWRAARGHEDLRLRFTGAGFDDTDWLSAAVPGHWRSTPGLEDCDGPVLYRTDFSAAQPVTGRRAFVVFDGWFYQGRVWLDGSHLGDSEGYFIPHAFEVTRHLQARTEHLLAVELNCPPPGGKSTTPSLTGAFQHGDCLDPDWNPGGIWRPVRVAETGPVRIASLRVRCTDAAAKLARLHVSAGLDAADAGQVELRTTVAPTGPAGTRSSGVEHRHQALLAKGFNELSWWVDVEDPPLWWPRALEPTGGAPALVDVEVQASPLAGPSPGGSPSDTVMRRTGLRQVRMVRSVLEVNGERLFVKGANLGPTRLALGEATAAEIEGDVTLAQDAGLDLLVVRGHISRPELYDAADRAGLLLWQDLALQPGGPGVHQARRAARGAVDLLAHHPSIAGWCGHDQPWSPDGRPRIAGLVRRLAPSASKTRLDASLARVVDRADGSRPAFPFLEGLRHLAWGDTHTSFGWYHGDERDLPGWLRRFPVLASFVGEFGAQGVPATAEWMEPERWPDLDWDRLVRSHGFHRAIFDRRAAPVGHPTFDAWRTATQDYQATVLRHHVEELRRLKYRPTGGFCQFSLADSHPAVSNSVLDHERVPKAAYAALRAACAPVIVVADRPAASYRPGSAMALDVHVVSDRRQLLEGCTVRAELAWPGGSHRWGYVGDVPADTVVRVGTLSFMVPDAPGALTLGLRLEGPAEATASYASEIRP